MWITLKTGKKQILLMQEKHAQFCRAGALWSSLKWSGGTILESKLTFNEICIG